MVRVKTKCPVCKRERGNLSWKDWQGHLRSCEKKRNTASGTPTMRKFVVSSASASRLTSASTSSKTSASCSGDGGNPFCSLSGVSACVSSGMGVPPACIQSADNILIEASDGDGVVAGECGSSAGEGDFLDSLPLEVQLHVPATNEVLADFHIACDDTSPSHSLSSESLVLSPIVDQPQETSKTASSLLPSFLPEHSNEPQDEHMAMAAAAASTESFYDCDVQGDHSCESDTEESKQKQFPEFNASDPASFCGVGNFVQNVTDKILTTGPNQPNEADLKCRAFPVTNGRSFKPNWYYQKLSDGTLQKRNWLSYSEKTDRVYCLDCILFGLPANKNAHPAFTKHGFQSWKRASASFIEHETSEAHVKASVAAELRKITLPLNASMQQERLKSRALNKEIVRQLIDVTLYLARHCLAFRGHREGHLAKLRGNFRDLVALLAKYSPALATYQSKVSSSKKKSRNFLSWNRQNQYIKAVAEFIKREIKKELSSALFFSVSFDETLDASRKEQCSCVIRYVRNDTGTVAERLVGLKACASTTGQKLFEVLESIFDELDLDWTTYLVGQSYDGASSMRGIYNGLQSLVREKAECAVYVWCWAHRLSLAVKEAVDCCLDAAELFCNIRALYNLINGSKNNVDLYENIFKKTYPGKQILRLKRIDIPRWMSHSFALTTLLKAFDAIVETLDQIEENGSGEAKASAHGLLTYLLSEKFVLTALTFQSIFKEVEPLSASLQGVDIDLMAAVNHVDLVLKELTSLRADDAFDNLLKMKDEFVACSQETFTPLPTVRRRRVKTRPGEKATDAPIDDPLKKLRVEMYFTSIDNITNLISERFNDRAQGLFKDLGLLTRQRMTDIAKDPSCFPKDAFAAFSSLYKKFISFQDIRREYIQFAKTFSSYESALKLPELLHEDENWIDLSEEDPEEDQIEADDTTEKWLGFDEESTLSDDIRTDLRLEDMKYSGSMARVLQVVHNSGLKKIFPTIYVALKIAVTLPVTSASTERTFSKLKLVKSRLRTSMDQKRLEDLLIITCESDIAVNADEVLSIFSSYSSYLSNIL